MNEEQLAEKLMVAIPTVGLIVLGIRFGGGFTGTGPLLAGAAVLGGLLVLVAFGRLRTRAATIGGRKIEVHTHGGHGTRLAARHEGGHVAVTRAVGGHVSGASISPDGSGVTWLQLPRNVSVVDRVAVDVAGEVAARTAEGCASDQAWMRQALAQLPASERGAVKRAGYARARGVCHGLFLDGGVSAVERKLLRDGKL